MTANASVPASMQRRAFSLMSVWFGDSLVMMRLLRRRAARRDDPRRHLGIVAERDAAFLHVGAGDVDLDRVDGRVVEAARDLRVLLDRRAGDVRDEARLAEVERRQDLAHDVVRAGVLQPDGVQHAGRRFEHAVRRIAEARIERRALQHDRRRRPGSRTLDARVFLAEPHAAREQHDGRGEIEPAEVEAKGVVDESGERRPWAGIILDRGKMSPARFTVAPHVPRRPRPA